MGRCDGHLVGNDQLERIFLLKMEGTLHAYIYFLFTNVGLYLCLFYKNHLSQTANLEVSASQPHRPHLFNFGNST